MPTEFVRIRDKQTKTESSVPRRRAEQLAGRDAVEILDKEPAVNGFGEPLPASTPDTKTAVAKTSKE
ncbi:hypothetical protein ACIBCR_16380 [Micromonospora echinospora]|uniref:hypothetical protein n=1 Tax=Micromonospora echinospora TaxID=1877 RepID=UPI0037899211